MRVIARPSRPVLQGLTVHLPSAVMRDAGTLPVQRVVVALFLRRVLRSRQRRNISSTSQAG
jgi:hypothetical protein